MRNWAGLQIAQLAAILSGHGAWRAHKDHRPCSSGRRDGAHRPLPRLCYHQAVKTFEELKLWNDMIFVDVPQDRHFVCTQCGGRIVKVMPIFPAARGTPGLKASLTS